METVVLGDAWRSDDSQPRHILAVLIYHKAIMIYYTYNNINGSKFQHVPLKQTVNPAWCLHVYKAH